ncbi:tetratricopeptide repeat protein [Hymenobacter jeollabukensis]|uniref:Tetratricopeptide repeat protein n=1 Tax=Hymenobacter jeollabukensis TaxID=2025313 RepID=A0A5R8WUM4_9BACT|nr:tetratricopeptide repeat protein [Hymenobacter jeollabukensis]TLM95469.1 tetratricopeptide repeat protein [Hymenobacter jeollabukensis]
MTNKPWKLSLLAAFSLAGPAVFAQNMPAARQSIELERYSEAKRQLLPNQSNPEAAYELGRLYLKQEKADSAAYFFNMASRDTKFPLAMVSSGRALLAQGKKMEADAQFDAAIKATKSKDANIYAAVGQAYAETDVKDNQKGIDAINQAIKLNKKDDAAWLVNLGDIYAKRDNGGGDAMNAYDRALRADGGYVRAYYRKGELSFRSRNGGEALTNFNKVTSINSNYAPVYRELANMYYYADKPDLAVENMKKYTDMAENTTATQATYAAFLYTSKKYPEAITQIQEVLAKDPNNVTMNRLLAYSLYESNQNDQALAAVEKYNTLVPADKRITDDYVYQGKILVKAGRSDEGIALIEKAIAANPDKAADLQNELVQAYILKKDYPKAERVLRQKMSKGTPALTDQVRLANVYTIDKKYAQADSLLNIVITARPTYTAGYLMRAQANSNLDPELKQALAKPHYEKYIEVAKADPAKNQAGLAEAYRYLGAYYYNAGNKAQALSSYQQAVAVKPDDAQAADAIKQLSAPTKAPAKAPVKSTKK